jgi:putative membrane protein
MRSMGSVGKLLPLALCAAAAFAVGSGCKSSTAGGSAGPGMGSDDGGMMMSMDGGMMMSMDGGMGGMSGMSGMMADAGAQMGEAAGNAARSASSSMQSAGESVADAGAEAYGSASSAVSGAANDMMDAGTQMASADMDAGSSGGGASLSDPQIASVAVAANKVDVDAARLAKSKSKNAKVKKFANDMIRDHSSANKQAVKLVKKLGVTPEENDTSRSLIQGGKENIAKLKKLKGKAFDKAYMEHEVAYHQQVLDALDKTLIPSAQNADLKSLLESVRGVIAQHLDHATSLSQSLSK